jgi:hypothetical protein
MILNPVAGRPQPPIASSQTPPPAPAGGGQVNEPQDAAALPAASSSEGTIANADGVRTPAISAEAAAEIFDADRLAEAVKRLLQDLPE